MNVKGVHCSMYIEQNTFTMHQNLCCVCIQRAFPQNETYLKTKYSINVKGVHCTKYFHNSSKSVKKFGDSEVLLIM